MRFITYMFVYHFGRICCFASTNCKKKDPLEIACTISRKGLFIDSAIISVLQGQIFRTNINSSIEFYVMIFYKNQQ